MYDSGFRTPGSGFRVERLWSGDNDFIIPSFIQGVGSTLKAQDAPPSFDTYSFWLSIAADATGSHSIVMSPAPTAFAHVFRVWYV